MNKIVVHPNHFSSEDQVFDELEINGLYVAEMDVPAVANEPHWHEFSTWLYILEGELLITDVAQDKTLKATRGARVDVPERILHHEESGGYKIIAGMTSMPEDPQNVDLPAEPLDTPELRSKTAIFLQRGGPQEVCYAQSKSACGDTYEGFNCL